MRLSLALLMAALVILPAASAHTVATLHGSYTGQPVGIGCYGILTPGDCPELENSAVVFGPFNATRVDFAIYDVTGARIGAVVKFYDATSVLQGEEIFCGFLRDVRVPNAATFVIVTLDTATTPKHCIGKPAIAVQGEVVMRILSR